MGNTDICRYHLRGNWYLRYWKSRGYFAACAAHAWKRKLHMRGIYIDTAVVTKLEEGRAFVKEAKHYSQH